MPPEKSPETSNDIVVLTGATRGLGLATARRLVEDGYCVVGVGRTLTSEFAELVDRGNTGTAHFCQYDLSETGGIQDLARTIVSQYGRPYGLINNAATGLDGVLATMHHRDIEHVLRVNLEAPIQLIKYLCRHMMLNRRGRIVNVSSIIANTGFSGLSVYAASKGGLESMTRSLARELGRVGITVNCVAPGFLQTDMTSSLEGGNLETIRRRSPLGLARVEDVAGAIAYLLGPDASHTTGSVVTVDGGSTA